ncbi:MAG: SDR family NAD(P)-dependent oxidoreductase [Sterolibacterium sp.]|nr:SDR family NAD(P)-dependent oxidoreductase [Sterolibacterium sp.]
MASKVVFITGAGSGMGQVAAKRALLAGSAVAALDVNAAGLEALGASERLLKLVVDITDPAAVKAAVERTERELGPIDRVINSAAIMPLGLLMKQDHALILRIMSINYGGLVNVARAALPGLLSRGRGDFISFSSIVGHVPSIYMGAYCSSKFAVCCFTEGLYHENRKSGVRFACVCPPAVATPLLDQARDTVWPKMFNLAPPTTPEKVLDTMEAALEKGRFWVMPEFGTLVYYWMRRFAPNLLWRVIHRVEGV